MSLKFKKHLFFFVTIILLSPIIGYSQSKNGKLEINEVAKDFYVYTTYGDPGNGELFPANGMYLVTNDGVILIDTPWDTTQFQPLLDSIKIKHNKSVSICIATHFHEDRTAGLHYYRTQGIKTFTTRKTDSLSILRNKPRAEFLLVSDTTFHLGQYSFETFYPGQGHSPDNIVIWFNNERILYGGCFIKSCDSDGPGNLSDANIPEWIESTKRVITKYNHPNIIIPGHQSYDKKSALKHTLNILNRFQKK